MHKRSSPRASMGSSAFGWIAPVILSSPTIATMACGGDEPPPAMGTSDSGIDPTLTGDESGAGENGTRLDVGAGTGMSGGADEGTIQGCDKIDFLFVIDNSGSMEDEQQNLVTSFPEFITSIQSATNVTNYQIMVIDTDECDESTGEGQFSACDAISDPDCCVSQCTTFPAGSCNGEACSCPVVADPCDAVLGGGKVLDKDGTACGIESDKRFMTADQADLSGVFACAAEVGIDGSGDEQTVESTIAAISEPLTGPGGCNEGFVRDDGLLVVVFITDEEDDHETSATGFPGFGSAGEPGEWYDAIVARKGGLPNNVVVLSLIGPAEPEPCPPLDKSGGGVEGAEVGQRLIEFTQMFPFGFVGPVCATSYKPFFDEAVGVIDEACDQFIPPG